MEAGFEPIGVEAIAKGVNKFLSDLTAMEKGYNKVTVSFSRGAGQVGDATKQTTSGLSGLGGMITKSLGGASGSIGSIVSAIGGSAGLIAGVGGAVLGVLAFKKAFEAIIDVAKRAATAVLDFTKQGMFLAGQFQEMEFTALAVGRAMGFQEDEIRGAIGALNEAGIRYDVAAKSVAMFARNQIDLARAGELANLAQATGIIIGEDSSATMERLVLAISTLNTTRLRALGITTQREDAERRYREEMQITGRELTQVESQQALTNAIIEDSAALLDVYGAAMQSPTKALRSLSGRVLPELQAAVGQYFLPAWFTAIKAISDFAVGLKDALQEGGRLYPIMIQLGAAASIVADAFAAVLRFITGMIAPVEATQTSFRDLGETMTGETVNAAQTVGNVIGDLVSYLGEQLGQFVQYGANLITGFADGIISTLDVLVGAMNAISGFLASWLAPGSPPKVAPDIGKWGIAAMAQYLHGFTQADFGVLSAIQGPLKQALSGADFAAISQDIISAISEGTVGETLFSRIAQSAGEFGVEIAELARRQFALADATRKVEESEERLKQAREGLSTAQADVSRQVQEYNQALREGATQDELQARMAELDASEQGVLAAQAQVKEAEAASLAAQERQKELEEQASLQDRLVNQLLSLAQAQDAADKSATSAADSVAKAAGGAAAALSGLSASMPTPASFEFASSIGDAIEAAKARILESAADLFKPLLDKWRELRAKIDEFKIAFEEFRVTITAAWLKFVGIFVINAAKANRWLSDLKTSVLRLAFAFTANLFLAMTKVYQWVRDVFVPFIRNVFIVAFENLKTTVVDAAAAAFGKLLDWVTKVKLGIEGLISGVSILISLIWGMVEAWEAAKSASDKFSGHSPSPLERGIRGASAAMREMSATLPSLAASFQRAPLAAAPTIGGTTSVQTTRNITVPVTINASISNDMDLMELGVFIEQTVRRAVAT